MVRGGRGEAKPFCRRPRKGTRSSCSPQVAKCLFSDKANGKVLSAVDKNQVFNNATFKTFDV